MPTMEAGDFTKAVRVSAQAVMRRGHIPILDCLHVAVADGQASFTGTDCDTRITIAVPAAGEPLSVCINAGLLGDIARGLDGTEQITLSANDNLLKIRCGKARWSLKTLSPDDFPSASAVDGGETIALSGGQLTRLFGRVLYACLKETTRDYLKGVCLQSRAGELIGVASDGHRIAISRLPLAVTLKGDAIVPMGLVATALKLFADSERVEMTITECAIRLRADGATLMGKLIDQNYVDYDRIVPTNGEVLECDRASLCAAIRRVSFLSDGKSRVVKLALSEDALVISTRGDDGEGSEELPCLWRGREMEAGFQAAYLLEQAQAEGSEKFKLAISDPSSPARTDGDGFTGVIVPYRI